MIISINCVPRIERRNTILATSIPSGRTRSLQLKAGAFWVLPRPPRPRDRLCQITENSVPLYVDPDHWGRGIGVALVSAACSRLFGLGFRTAILRVLESNVRAERFM